MKQATNKRDTWVDVTKWVACILVVLGHLWQSLVKAQILSDSDEYRWFIQTIYYFHVPLFFICSGYLYQKYSKVYTLVSWRKNVIRKGVALGIPYFLFSTITWGLKFLFSGEVNENVGEYFETIFCKPLSPYWFLYALLLLFIVIPTYKNGRMVCKFLLLAMMAKIISRFGLINAVWFQYLSENAVWFVAGMGMVWAESKLVYRLSKQRLGVLVGIVGMLFFSISTFLYDIGFCNMWISWGMGILGCLLTVLFSVLVQNNFNRISEYAQYLMPVFLMHTLFAAPVRIVLLRIGLTNGILHALIGTVISFVGPILITIVGSRIKLIDFMIYPGKYIRMVR